MSLLELLRQSNMAEALLDLVPIGLAIYALSASVRRGLHSRRLKDKLTVWLVIVVSLTFILTHMVWWSIYLLTGSGGKAYGNVVFTLYDCLVMIIFIRLSGPRTEYDPTIQDTKASD